MGKIPSWPPADGALPYRMMKFTASTRIPAAAHKNGGFERNHGVAARDVWFGPPGPRPKCRKKKGKKLGGAQFAAWLVGKITRRPVPPISRGNVRTCPPKQWEIRRGLIDNLDNATYGGNFALFWADAFKRGLGGLIDSAGGRALWIARGGGVGARTNVTGCSYPGYIEDVPQGLPAPSGKRWLRISQTSYSLPSRQGWYDPPLW